MKSVKSLTGAMGSPIKRVSTKTIFIIELDLILINLWDFFFSCVILCVTKPTGNWSHFKSLERESARPMG